MAYSCFWELNWNSRGCAPLSAQIWVNRFRESAPKTALEPILFRTSIIPPGIERRQAIILNKYSSGIHQILMFIG
jgi:hypothetical protein